MNRAVNFGRSTNKRRGLVNISDDESIENRPVEKSVRREVETVSLCEEVLAIHHKMHKLERDKQGAIRIAAEAQARVEFLENLVDKKRVILRDVSNLGDEPMEELQKKVSDLKEQLADAVYLRMQDREKIRELTRKQAKTNDKEKKQMDELQKKVSSLMKQLDDERSQANEDRAKDRAKIAELTDHRDELARKLAEAGSSEKKQQKKIDELTRQLPPQSPPIPAAKSDMQRAALAKKQWMRVTATGSDPSTAQSSLARTGESDNSTNIFEVHYTSGPEYVPYRHARKDLCEIGNTVMCSFQKEERPQQLLWIERRKKLFESEKLHCALCKKTFNGDLIIDHFVSEDHKLKVVVSQCNTLSATRGTHVSRVAFDYWKNNLELITKKLTLVTMEHLPTMKSTLMKKRKSKRYSNSAALC